MDEKVTATYFLCDEDYPVLLAKIGANSKDFTTEIVSMSYAQRVTSDYFKQKCTYFRVAFGTGDKVLLFRVEWGGNSESLILVDVSAYIN